jgi:mortality factor 4-like protein 1
MNESVLDVDGKAEIEQSTVAFMHQDPLFRKEEKVLCPDNDTLYEGIIRKYQRKTNGDGWRYLVHYLGWNSRWDKWLDENDILVASDANVQAMKIQQKKRKREATNIPMSLDFSRSKSRCLKGHERTMTQYCELPFTLKTILADEKERIMRKGFEGGYDGATPWAPSRDVHALPAAITIHTVLQHFVKLQMKAQSLDSSKMEAAKASAQHFVSSLSDLFDEALPVCLLYPPERAQYVYIRKQTKITGTGSMPLVKIYGCEFLLRLLVRLPALLLDVTSPKLGQQIAILIVVLQKNRMSCFRPNFVEPLEEEWNDWEFTLRKESISKSKHQIYIGDTGL